MRSLTVAGFLIASAVVIVAEPASDLPLDNRPLEAVSRSYGLFAGNFFKNVVVRNPQKNLITSPLSASIVLAMTQYGARGNTQEQMKSALHLPTDERVSRTGYQNLIDSLSNTSNVTLNVANKIFVNKGFRVKQDFTAITRENFHSEIQQVNFTNSAEAVASINKWIDSQTNHKIKEILSDGDLSGTSLVLCSTLYFKGLWAKPFDTFGTGNSDFHVDNKTVKKVPSMQIISTFNNGYLPELNAKWVELPYQNKDSSMIIIVPNAVDGLSSLVEGLVNYTLADLRNREKFGTIRVLLPKFKIESTATLNKPLEQMGMIDMFTDNADFTGIADAPLKVSRVLQKAFIEVNEGGTEVAAVTKSYVIEKTLPLYIRANRPFVIIVQAKGTVLFEGTVVDPQQPITEA